MARRRRPAGNSLDSTELLAGVSLAMAIAIIIPIVLTSFIYQGNTAWARWTLFNFLRGAIAPLAFAGIT